MSYFTENLNRNHESKPPQLPASLSRNLPQLLPFLFFSSLVIKQEVSLLQITSPGSAHHSHSPQKGELGSAQETSLLDFSGGLHHGTQSFLAPLLHPYCNYNEHVKHHWGRVTALC